MTGELGCRLPKLFLIAERDKQKWLLPGALLEIGKFAAGIGSEKTIVKSDPGVVKMAHERKLSVTLYTFSSRDTGSFADVRQEMTYYLHKLGVDALFTDNPDQFPR